jgi:hypothetical protein
MKATELENVEKAIDAWVAEIDRGTLAVRDNPNADFEFIRGFIDRWDELESRAFRMWLKVYREHFDAKAIYDDQLREQLFTASKRRQSDFSAKEERMAVYETKVLTFLQELRKHERVKIQLDSFIKYAKGKQKWLDSKRFNLHHEEKKEMHISSKEYLIRD